VLAEVAGDLFAGVVLALVDGAKGGDPELIALHLQLELEHVELELVGEVLLFADVLEVLVVLSSLGRSGLRAGGSRGSSFDGMVISLVPGVGLLVRRRVFGGPREWLLRKSAKSQPAGCCYAKEKRGLEGPVSEEIASGMC
jgi:hypothetical protein